MVGVVIDTNVIVSAIKTPNGTPAKIIDLILSEKIKLYLSADILEEYVDVLARPKHKLSIEHQRAFIDAIIEVGVLVKPKQSDVPMRDEDDRVFYDLAKAFGLVLVTGDKDLLVLGESFIKTPSEFLASDY